MKIINPVTVLCTETQFLDASIHQEVIKYPFQFILRSNGKVLKRFKSATNKWLALNVDKIPGIACPFAELGIEKGSLVPTEVLTESFDFLPAGKMPIGMLHQIIAFFKSVMQYKMKDVLRNVSSSSFSHNYEAQIFVVYNPASGYSLRVPTQRVSAASVSYDHDCYDTAAGDVVVLDMH